MFETWWYALPIVVQDGLVAAALLTPIAVTGVACLWGYRVMPLVVGLLRKHLSTSLTFTLLIACSVAISIGLIAQERGLREGTARAADKFDLIVAAPGSEITAMLAAVYLQPTALPLIDGNIYQQIENHPLVELAAPLAFGDSWEGRRIVGTTAAFVTHMSTPLAAGYVFSQMNEAVVGANVPLDVGDVIAPTHGDGDGDGAEEDTYNTHDFSYVISGKMTRTGSPWDDAIMVSVETVWDIHAMPIGHGPEWDGSLGGPFDPAYFSGTPAVLVRAEALWANYSLQSEFNTAQTMAFFPGNVLAQLHALMGDIRQVMQVLAITTQVLVAVAVLTGLSMLSRILAKRMALLRALGAPRRFIFGVTWSFATILTVVGATVGIVLGMLATQVLSRVLTAQTGILIETGVRWPEVHLVASFVSTVALLSHFPAYLASKRNLLDDLRI